MKFLLILFLLPVPEAFSAERHFNPSVLKKNADAVKKYEPLLEWKNTHPVRRLKKAKIRKGEIQ